jgi:hypothetical protein
MTQKIHLHSGMDGFCGTTECHRRFTLDPNEVTCDNCIHYTLSPQGVETLKQCTAMAEYEAKRISASVS